MTTSKAAVPMPKAALPEGALAAGAFLVPCLLCLPRDSAAQIVVIVLAAIAALWIAYHQPIAERYLRKHAGKRWLLIIGCSTLLSIMAIGDLVSAQWWVMDDHEVALILGNDHEISFGETLAALGEHPEVGNIGERSRVRPVYYIIRFTEAWLWGDNLALWYSARVIALAAVFLLCWHLLWKWYGGIDAGLCLLLIFCWRMWGDVWSRIGSSETYCMIGVAIAVVGVLLSERAAPTSRGRNAASWMLIFLGCAVAMGCKENFLILVPATIGYAVSLWYRGRLGGVAVAGTLAVTTAGGLIALAVVGSLASKGGVDIYANERSLTTLLMASVRCVTTHFGAVMLATIVGLMIFARRLSKDDHFNPFLPQIKTSIWAMAGLLVLFVSQYAFYNDFSVFSNRYAFPAALAPFLMLLLLVQLYVRFRKIRGDDRISIRRAQFALRLAIVLLVCGMGLVMQQRSSRHVEQTAAFTTELIRVAGKCRHEPSKPIVFISHGPQDYETLYSVAAFLRFYDVSNPIYLRLEGYEKTSDRNDFDGSLVQRLETVSREGNETFLPIGELTTASGLIGIGFSDSSADVACIAQFPCWK